MALEKIVADGSIKVVVTDTRGTGVYTYGGPNSDYNAVVSQENESIKIEPWRRTEEGSKKDQASKTILIPAQYTILRISFWEYGD